MPQYRLSFKKEKPIRFISHLDMVKVFERAVRRGGIPVAFSQGFNPHPKISFALPVPVGVTADQEYIDLELKEDIKTDLLKNRLNDNLPPGLQIIDIKMKDTGQKPIMSLIDMADYSVIVDSERNITRQDLEEMIQEFLAKPEIIINKKTKKNEKPTNILPGIFSLLIEDISGSAVSLGMRLKAGNEGNIRPEDVIKGLNKYLGLNLDISTAMIHRKNLITSGQA